MSGIKKNNVRMPVDAFWHYRLRTESNDALRNSLVRASESMLREHFIDLSTVDMGMVREHLHYINRYPNLPYLNKHPKSGQILEIPSFVRAKAKKEVASALLEGSIIRRIEAGGESSRLGLGARYLLMPDVLVRAGKEMGNGLLASRMKELQDEGIVNNVGSNILPISLGDRHMLQIAFMQAQIGREFGFLKHQWKEMLVSTFTLVNLNSSNRDEIFRDHISVWGHYGFTPERTLYTEQEPEHGYSIREGRLVVDERSEKRLFNHGLMMLKCAMDGNIFRIDENGPARMSAEEFFGILEVMSFMKSSPVEDADFLHQKPDYPGFSTALRLAKAGYNMVMEVIGQKEEPQKGGVWMYDTNYDRPVMIESDMLGIEQYNEESFNDFLKTTEILNRNMNYYLSPAVAHRKLLEYGLPMHLNVRETNSGMFLYPQPPHGDSNFLLNTAFVKKRNAGLIKGLKVLSDIPDMLRAMSLQDSQPGFRHFVEQFGVLKKKTY